eukprot:6189807-Pleurochrysis_carterae.AAC.4
MHRQLPSPLTELDATSLSRRALCPSLAGWRYACCWRGRGLTSSAASYYISAIAIAFVGIRYADYCAPWLAEHAMPRLAKAV